MLGFAACEPLSQRALAERFGCDPSNISVLVDRLVERELVERRPDPSDGRVKLIAATDAGRALADRCCRTASGSGPRSTASRRTSSRPSVRDSHCSRAGDATIQAVEHLDVVIVGAGLSGIGAAHHLQDRLPGLSYAILEGREAIGGTWDLFRYPGVRSDSDMQTLGYRFKPWTDEKSLADGPSILEYVRETAREAGHRRQGALRAPGPRRRVGRRALDARHRRS